MTTARGGEDVYLTYLDVFDEEDRELSGTTESEPDPLREAHRIARRDRDSLPPGDSRIADAERTVAAAEQAFRLALFRRLHRRKRTALCFSGGGIRSSTFALGIMQGLAGCSRQAEGQERPELLGEIDYLSTVSGGGYLGAWFSSWATRAAKPNVRNFKGTPQRDTCDGPAHVMAELAKSPDSTFEPEPPQVHHLRQYSNYLAPHRGLFSADTWTLVSHVLRNIFLNWLVLIPLFSAALLVPVLAWRLLLLKPDRIDPSTLWYLIITAFVFGAFSVGYVGYDLPNAGNARRTAGRFLTLCLIPLGLAAVHLNVFWAWLPNGDPSGPWWDIVTLGKLGIKWYHFAFFGAAMHGGGMLLGILYVMFRYKRPAPHIGLAATVAAGVTGFIGGLAARLATFTVAVTALGHISHPRAYAVLAFPVVLAIFLLSQTLLVGAGSYITEDEDREWWARSGGWLIAVAGAWLGIAYLVLFSIKDLHWANVQLSTAFTAATGLTGWMAARAGKSPDTSAGKEESSGKDSGSSKLFSNPLIKEYGARLLLPVFVILLTLLLGGADMFLVHQVVRLPAVVPNFWPGPLRPMGEITAPALWVMLAELALCMLASYFININKFSLHGMYRLRLIRAFLGGSNMQRKPNLFTGFDESDNIPMANLTSHRPLHLVNIALNLVHGKNLAWQQRKAESFTSSRLHTGSCRVGYRSSSEYGGRYRKGRRPISLGTAVTISGAAASPNMGYHSSPLLTLVMTLFNARLGWWLGNPKASASVWRRPGPRLGIRPFIDEAFGLTDDEAKWLYLSDGGHFENLGIYEMVLRRVHRIILCDASADPTYEYEDIANAVRKIRVDMGIPIEFGYPTMPTSPAGKSAEGVASHHCTIARIRYGAVDPGADDGILIYIKPSLNGNESADVRHYASAHKFFPHEPTKEQFYDEAQFESYRRLGLHTIEEICGAAFYAGMDLNGFQDCAERYTEAPPPSSLLRLSIAGPDSHASAATASLV